MAKKLQPGKTMVAREGRFKEAIDMLCAQKLLKEAVQLLDHIDRPSASIYSSLLLSCLQQRSLFEGKRVHSHMKVSDFIPGIFISNRLMDMYAKCGSLRDAHKVFDEMNERDLCSWNTMIKGYAKTGKVEFARKLFDEMPHRDGFSWTAMISCYVQHERPKEALDLYREMQNYGNLDTNKFTISSAIAASAAIPSLLSGKEIHGRIVRMNLESDSAVWSALSDMYAKCGSIEEARHVFDKTVDRDVVSWTSMMDGYFEEGRWEDGFALFTDMLRSGIRPNEFTFAGVMNACADQALENIGKQVHGHMIRIAVGQDSFAASALVHMYSKCGNVRNARKAFEGLNKPDLVSWTSLIVGFAQNGHSEESLELFELMLRSDTQPDHVTFVGVLSACTHAGLVDKGIEYFHSINDRHGLTPIAEHYSCLIDLLSRAGRFKEVEEYISNMPMKPDRFLWASVLGGCRIHKNVELAEQAAKALFEIEPENAATYATLANIYATAGRWEEVAKVRKMMDSRGVVKKPGQSWIEVKRQVHRFLVGDTSHPKYNEIHAFLAEISKKMKQEGYVPDTNFVLHDVEEEQKEQNLSYHSEKLAVAFGIVSTPPGTPIKVYKNLRTCVDCHTAIKFISKITKRKITVRDSNRGFASIADAIIDIHQGKMVVILDVEMREHKGYVMVTASRITAEAVDFLLKRGTGIIYLTYKGEELEQLQVPCTDVALCSTACVLATEIATTIRVLVSREPKFEGFHCSSPVSLLKCSEGGVLERASHAEAAVDLAVLARLEPMGSIMDGIEHIAMVKGTIGDGQDVLVRLHSECLTGDIFGSARCDCGNQLALAMQLIERAGRGVLVYNRGHEGRGIGLGYKLRAYTLQDAGLDTADANIELGLPVDSRECHMSAQILRHLGVRSLKLLTNNPVKCDELRSYGLAVVDRVPVVTSITKENERYLETKRAKMNHMFSHGSDS
ncbi:hypothetical protein RDABS01_004897 [Bienertia sinuspersici]